MKPALQQQQEALKAAAEAQTKHRQKQDGTTAKQQEQLLAQWKAKHPKSVHVSTKVPK